MVVNVIEFFKSLFEIKVIFFFLSDVCGSAAKFEELAGRIKEAQPSVTVNGTIGRQGYFLIFFPQTVADLKGGLMGLESRVPDW